MADLVERLREAIEARKAGAAKLQRIAQDNQLAVLEPRLLGRSVPGWFDWPDVEQMAAVVLLGVAEDLAILDRHRPGRLVDSFGKASCRGGHAYSVDFDACPEIRSLARRYPGIDTEEKT